MFGIIDFLLAKINVLRCDSCGRYHRDWVAYEHELMNGKESIDPDGNVVICYRCINTLRCQDFLNTLQMNTMNDEQICTHAIGFQIPNLEDQDSEEEPEE